MYDTYYLVRRTPHILTISGKKKTIVKIEKRDFCWGVWQCQAEKTYLNCQGIQMTYWQTRVPLHPNNQNRSPAFHQVLMVLIIWSNIKTFLVISPNQSNKLCDRNNSQSLNTLLRKLIAILYDYGPIFCIFFSYLGVFLNTF